MEVEGGDNGQEDLELEVIYKKLLPWQIQVTLKQRNDKHIQFNQSNSVDPVSPGSALTEVN